MSLPTETPPPTTKTTTTTTGLSRPQTSFAFRRQPVDLHRVAVLFLKWPMIAFRFLRRGRFAAIAELRRDSAKLLGRHEESIMSLQNLEEEDDDGKETTSSRRKLNLAAALASMGSLGTAFAWTFILVASLVVATILPQFTSFVSVLFIIGPFIAILTTLSSITRDSAKYAETSPSPTSSSSSSTSDLSISNLITNLLAGVFFVVSTFPFALPWVIAFFFPYECLLFFSAWAVFGAIINEVAVLVSHNQVMRGGNTPAIHEPSHVNPTRPIPTTKRKRKTTAQRLATVSNFTKEDREELEEFLVSAEGLRWWGAFLDMQGMISAGSVFLALAAELWFVPLGPAMASWTLFSMVLSSCGLMESFWMTYAVGGRWLHFRQKWRFFQPFRGGRQFVMLNSLSWFLFFVALLTLYRDMGPSFMTITHKMFPGTQLPWYVTTIERGVFDTVNVLCRMIGLNAFPRGFGAVAGVFAELLLLVSLPLYQGETNLAYLDSAYMSTSNHAMDLLQDEVLNVTEEHENQLDPPPLPEPPQPPPTTHHPKEIQDELRAARDRLRGMKKTPLKSQFSVPLWEMTADALRTAWLSPIVLTLTKPEVVLFLVGFFMTKFVHGTHFPSYLTMNFPAIFSADAKFDYPTALVGVEIIYLWTYRGNPSRTGSRRKWSWRGTWVYDELAAHFYTHIVRERELNPSERHIFGYIPHGMFPMAASYLHNTTQWMTLFPDIVCVSLVATITHVVPFLREVTQFNGGIEVTTNSFTNALRTFRNVFLVPGGQHEMLLMPVPKKDLSGQPDGEYLPVSTKHKGFIKLALLAAAENPDVPVNLVPMYSFGESDVLFNAFPASIALQRWLVAKFRVNPAFLPVGRFYLAGVPKRVPVTVVVGPPLRVPIVNGIPTEAQVDVVHRRFYSMVAEVFRRNRGLCDGFENSEVEFHPKLEHGEMSEKEFIQAWAQVCGGNAGQLGDLRVKKDVTPWGEYMIAILMSQAALWGPFLFFGP